MNLAAAGFTKAQLTAHVVSFAINVLGNIVLIPMYGIKGAAVATLLSLWTVNGICLILMKYHLGLHPFNRKYLTSLATLLIVGFVLALALRTTTDLTDLSLLVTFVALLITSMGITHHLGSATDTTDHALVRALIDRHFRRSVG
jgi:O-antigen/teichoic acid export membrane protein